MADDVSIKVGLDTSRAKQSLDNLKSSVLKAGAVIAAAFGAKKIIDAAVQQENAINALNQALIRTGDYSEQASKDLQKFASDLQDVSTIGDETTLELLALAKSFGVSNEEAKKLVTTAADASVALGVDARTALEQLGGTLSGTQGRLAKFIPEVKNLSIEALKNGDAIDIFAEKFKGAATGELNTFSGALKQTTNIIGDFAEELGFLITQSPIIIKGIKLVGDGFKSAIGFLQANGGAIRETFGQIISLLITGLGTVVQTVLPPLIESLQLSFKIMGALRDAVLGVLKSFLGFSAVGEIVNTVYRYLLAVADLILFLSNKAIGGLIKGFQALGRLVGAETKNITGFLDGINGGIDDLRKGVEGIADADAAGSLREMIDEAGNVSQAAQGVVDETLTSIKDGVNNLDFAALGKSVSDGLKGRIKIAPTASGGTSDSSSILSEIKGALDFDASKVSSGIASVGSAISGTITATLGAVKAGAEQFASSQKELDSIDDQLKKRSLLSNEKILELEQQRSAIIEGQKEATKQAGIGLVQAIASKIPVIGEIISGLLEFLKDPKAIKDFVKALSEALPDVIKGLADALPDIIDAFIAALPDIIDALIDAIPILIDALIDAIPRIIIAIIEKLPALIKAIVDKIPDIIDGFIEALPDIITAIVDAIPDIIEAIILALPAIIEALIRAIPKVVVALINGIGRLIGNLASAFGRIASTFAKGVANAANEFINKLLEKVGEVAKKLDPTKGAKNFGDKVSSEISGLGKKLGFADGGIVPAGFPNDTAVANVTSGEMILNADQQKNLFRLLDRGLQGSGGNQSSSQMITVNLVMNEEVLASQILELNRDNQRIA